MYQGDRLRLAQFRVHGWLTMSASFGAHGLGELEKPDR